MSKATAATEEQNLNGAIKAAQKEADSLTKEQIKDIIEATRKSELEALTTMQKYYEDLQTKFAVNITHGSPTPQKLDDVKSILNSIAITQKTVSEGVSSKLHQKLVQDQELISTTDNLEKEVQQAAKHWKKIAATRNDDRPSSLSLASDHIMSIAKYSANTVPAAYNVARAVAEYMVMTVIADSVTKGFDHLAQIYKKGKQYSDVTRAKIGLDHVIDSLNFATTFTTDKDLNKLDKAKKQLSDEMGKIKQKLNMTIKQDFIFPTIDEAYFIQDYVEKLPKDQRPDLTLLKQYRNEYIKAFDSTVLTKVASTLTGIIASGTQAIMAPIRIALTTTSNIAYTPVGIYKNYQSYKKDDKGNVKNWAKSTAIIREELTAKRKEKAQASFAQTVQKRSTNPKKGRVQSY